MATRILSRVAHGGWRSRIAAALVVAAALFLLVILFDAATSYNEVHGGVTVSGIEVGSMSREEARSVLMSEVQRAQASEITLTAEGQDWPVLPDDVGTQIDVSGTIESAFTVGRSGNVFRDIGVRLKLYFSPRDIPLQGTVDTVLLDHLLANVAGALDKPPVNAGLQVEDGAVTVIEGSDGLVVDQDLMRDELKGLLLTLHATELPVPMTVVPPEIQAANTSDAVRQTETMISGPVTLARGDQVWTLSPESIAKYLAFTVEGESTRSRLVPYISAEKAAPFLEEVASVVNKEPANATWETDGSRAYLVEAKVGMKLEAKKTAEALTVAALSPTDRQAEVQGTEVQPNRTTEEAEAMGIKEKIGSYTTEFGGSENRRDNVQLAAKKINGTLIAPGEQFDFDTVVGPRTPERGFKTAPVIVSGGKLEDALGGGICQVSTTLFNAVFFAGLDVTARTNHSLYISHYPKGRDATVSWGGPAFRFRNDTQHWILIKSASSRGSLTFVIYGTPVNRQVDYTTGDWYNLQSSTEKRVNNPDLPEGETRVVDDGQTGKQIKVTRRVIQDGKTIHDDVFVSTYPMHPKVIEVGTKPPETTTTTKAPASTTTTERPASSTTTEPVTTSTTP